MSIIHEVARLAADIANFAIVEQPDNLEMLRDRARLLGRLNILPIWYPHGHHELIEPLLHSLAIARLGSSYPKGKPQRLWNVPLLPEHFISRPGLMEQLKERVLSGEGAAPGILSVTAIHGLGGIGKTTIAAALAHEPDVRERFKGGVLWTTLGPEPDLLSLILDWIRALGDRSCSPNSIRAASIRLRDLLSDHCALLIVDNVWEKEHADPFLCPSPQNRAVITTRRAHIAEAFGAHPVDVDLMTLDESVALLNARLRVKSDNVYYSETARIAKGAGFLPLALDLASARILRRAVGATLSEALEEEATLLEAVRTDPPTEITETGLEPSFNLRLTELRKNDEAYRAFALLAVVRKGSPITALMAATLWGIDDARAATLLDVLWSDALLLPGPQLQIQGHEWRSYAIHDLLHDVARRLLLAQLQGSRSSLADAHREFL